jgi:hypothetical protein
VYQTYIEQDFQFMYTSCKDLAWFYSFLWGAFLSNPLVLILIEYISPHFSWSVHHNFVHDGKYRERGRACTPHLHQAGLIFPSWWNMCQMAAVATLCMCTLWKIATKQNFKFQPLLTNFYLRPIMMVWWYPWIEFILMERVLWCKKGPIRALPCFWKMEGRAAGNGYFPLKIGMSHKTQGNSS